MSVYSQTEGYIICQDESVWQRIQQQLANHPAAQASKGRPVIFATAESFIYHPANQRVYFTIAGIKARPMPDVLNFWEELVVDSQCDALFLSHSIELHYPPAPFNRYQAEWVKDDSGYIFESNLKLSLFWQSQFADESDYLHNDSELEQHPTKTIYPWLEHELEQWDFYCRQFGEPKLKGNKAR
ncbi:hypothetical protein L9G74_12725 [Shewanella sp. C32]|uniref:Uncharacterized protein n=1 Tax=Shewanella electrica TaxID=515560 RepID=A0ABT2FLU3_9GAMM|nr:hypothetical protein [Shewanella electrica]MCH1925806.1 hypothetical protein [Shewanella electrica]MCS4557309.1 hypothetical protein [Shewanella electrica]